MARLAGTETLRPGTILSRRFRVERQVGQGSMGIVLEATDLPLHRRVAIKLMAPERAKSEEARKRFLREARAAFTLTSRHVTRFLDVGELDDGTPFLVMEFLVGATLAQVLTRDGPPAVDVAVDWILQALDGVADAHREGFVHRDLKPENLFLCEADGQPGLVKVLDFGTVKDLVSKGTKLTKTGSTMGSPAYMAPEQVRAEEIDRRVDVWAMGVTLYEIVTGHLPFPGKSVPQTLTAILRDDPAPLRAHRPDAPPELEAVIACALSKDPARRYASGAELLGALATVRAKMPRTTRVTKTVHLGRNLRIAHPDAFADTTDMNAFADPDPSRVRPRLALGPDGAPPAARRSSRAAPLLLALGGAIVAGGITGLVLTRGHPPAPAAPASASGGPPAVSGRAAGEAPSARAPAASEAPPPLASASASTTEPAPSASASSAPRRRNRRTSH